MFQGAGHASKTFHLDWIVFTHPDEDHIGAGKQFADMLGRYWSVGTVDHNGMGRFDGTARQWTSSAAGVSQLGEVVGNAVGELYLSSLIDGFADVDTYEKPAPGRSWTLSGNWADILKKLRDNRGGTVAASIGCPTSRAALRSPLRLYRSKCWVRSRTAFRVPARRDCVTLTRTRRAGSTSSNRPR